MDPYYGMIIFGARIDDNTENSDIDHDYMVLKQRCKKKLEGILEKYENIDEILPETIDKAKKDPHTASDMILFMFCREVLSSRYTGNSKTFDEIMEKYKELVESEIKDLFEEKFKMSKNRYEEIIDKFICPICVDDVMEIKTKCNHKFCKKCYYENIPRKDNIINCPLCKTEINIKTDEAKIITLN